MVQSRVARTWRLEAGAAGRLPLERCFLHGRHGGLGRQGSRELLQGGLHGRRWNIVWLTESSGETSSPSDREEASGRSYNLPKTRLQEQQAGN